MYDIRHGEYFTVVNTFLTTLPSRKQTQTESIDDMTFVMGNGQTRVPDWTRVLKDRPHYSSVEVQQVRGRDIRSPQLFEKVQT